MTSAPAEAKFSPRVSSSGPGAPSGRPGGLPAGRRPPAAIIAVTRAALGATAVFSAATVGVCVAYRHDRLAILLAVLAAVLPSVSIVAAAAVRAAPRNPVTWILLAAGVSMPLAIGSYLYAAAAYLGGHDLPAARWAGWLDGWPWVPAMVLVPLVGLLLFPDGRPPSRRWRPLVWLGGVVSAALFTGALLGPTPVDFPEQPNPTALPGAAGDVAAGLMTVIALVAPLSTVAAFALHRRRRRIDDPLVAQAMALVMPAAWLIPLSWWSCIVFTAVYGDANAVYALPGESVGMFALAVTSWAAIRRYRLFDARLVLNRGLLYAALSVAVAGVYLAVAATIGVLASGGVSRSVAVAVAVLVALPLRDLLRRAVNRLVYGYRDDPPGAFDQLSRRLADATAPADVLPSVAATVRAALRLPYVGVQLGREVVAAAGTPGDGPRDELPLVFAGETIGRLVVEAREGERGFTAAERGLLAGLARQVAAAAHAVSLTTNLLRSRERLVAATENERRRLRRDLHDGLGPALAGVVLGLQHARRRVATDPVAAGQTLDLLTAQTQQAVAEVRRLVYGLRPPALDELGLVGALTEQARSLGPITVSGPAGPLALPAAVEVAVYRIAMEAMTNVSRHARASSATVHLRVEGGPGAGGVGRAGGVDGAGGTGGAGLLCVEIADDGAGLPAAYRAGVGITSMRERATELGGTCAIEPRIPHGTLVRAVFPLVVPEVAGSEDAADDPLRAPAGVPESASRARPAVESDPELGREPATAALEVR